VTNPLWYKNVKRHVTFLTRGEEGVPVHYRERGDPKENILIGPRPKGFLGTFAKDSENFCIDSVCPPHGLSLSGAELVRTSQRTHSALSLRSKGARASYDIGASYLA